MFSYALLHRRRFPEARMPAYVQEIGFQRDLNAAVFRTTPDALAAMIVGDLLRSGAIRREGGDLVPAAAEAG